MAQENIFCGERYKMSSNSVYIPDHDYVYEFIEVHKDGTMSVPHTYRTLHQIGNANVGESFVVNEYLPIELDGNTIEILGRRIA